MRSPGRALPPLPTRPPAAASERAASGSAALFPPPSPRPPLRPQPRPRSAPGRRRATAPPRGPEGDAAREPGAGLPRTGRGEAGSPQAAHPDPASPWPLALTTNPGGGGAPCRLGTGTLWFCVPSTSSYVTPFPFSDRKLSPSFLRWAAVLSTNHP